MFVALLEQVHSSRLRGDMYIYYTTTLNVRTPLVKTTSRALYSPVNMRACCPPFLAGSRGQQEKTR